MRTQPCRWLALVAAWLLTTACHTVDNAPFRIEGRSATLWSGDTSGALTVRELDRATGDVLRLVETPVDGAVEFLAFHPLTDWVYVLTPTSVQAFVHRDGALVRLGGAPVAVHGTHLELDRTGRWLFVASYGEDLVQVHPVGDDGVPGSAVQVLGADGQDFCPNAHQVRVHPNNRWVFAPCLGADGVRTMAFDAATGRLEAGAFTQLAAGAGPRHMDFHPSLDLAYVLNEKSSTLEVLGLDPLRGRMQPLWTVPGVPAGEPASRSSDIHVAADGEWLVAIHREPRDEVVGFHLDARGFPSEAWRLPLAARHARTCSLLDGLFAVGVTRGRQVQLYQLRGERPPQRIATFETKGDVMCARLRGQ